MQYRPMQDDKGLELQVVGETHRERRTTLLNLLYSLECSLAS